MFCPGKCRWRPAGGWQGTGATLVATNAATQLSRLSRTSKTKLHFKTLHTIAKMLALFWQTFTKRLGRIGPRCAFGEYKYCPLTWSGARKGGRFGTSPETDRRPVYTSYLYLAVVGKDTPLCVFGAAEAVHCASSTIGTHWRRPELPSANNGVSAPQTKTPPYCPSPNALFCFIFI